MSTNNQTQPQVEQKPKTLFGKTLAHFFKIIGLLAISLFFSLILEYIGLVFWWPEEGWQHSQRMFQQELSWLSNDFKQSLLMSSPGHFISLVIEQVFDWVMIKTGLLELTQTAQIKAQGKGSSAFIASIYVVAEDFILASVFIVMTFIIRFSILVLSIPLFIMAALTAIVDGLIRRDIRKFGAGRESSFIYHRAKKLIVPMIVAPWFLYLSAPIAVYPQLILIPCAISLGIAILVTITTFKKYL